MSVRLEEILAELEQDQRQLAAESRVVYDTIVKQTFRSGGHHSYMTLWAYMMSALARVDLYSRLVLGERKREQTARMLEFLELYLPRTPLAHRLVVQLWRHTLMHTARPRRLRDRVTGKEHYYLLHWGTEQLPREQHYSIQDGANLALCLECLLEDLAGVLAAIRAAAAVDATLAARIVEEWSGIELQDF